MERLFVLYTNALNIVVGANILQNDSKGIQLGLIFKKVDVSPMKLFDCWTQMFGDNLRANTFLSLFAQPKILVLYRLFNARLVILKGTKGISAHF